MSLPLRLPDDRDVAHVYCPACWWQQRVFWWDRRQYGERAQRCPRCGVATVVTELAPPRPAAVVVDQSRLF